VRAFFSSELNFFSFLSPQCHVLPGSPPPKGHCSFPPPQGNRCVLLLTPYPCYFYMLSPIVLFSPLPTFSKIFCRLCFPPFPRASRLARPLEAPLGRPLSPVVGPVLPQPWPIHFGPLGGEDNFCASGWPSPYSDPHAVPHDGFRRLVSITSPRRKFLVLFSRMRPTNPCLGGFLWKFFLLT